MTTRQRTTANILLATFAAAMIAAAIAGWRMYDATTAAASERADVTASELADLQAQLDQQTTLAANLRATLAGQYDVNADQADQVADLKARLFETKDAPAWPEPRWASCQ